TTVSAGTLVVNGSIGNSLTTVNTSGTLGGIGSISGPLTVQAGGTLAPGIPGRGALTPAIGALTAGNVMVNGTIVMKIDRLGTPNSDRLVAPAVVVNPGAALVVTNLGSAAFAAGDTFTLFSVPVSGSFTVASLPPLPSPDMYWTNRLTVDGTIAVASVLGNNPTPTNITATVSDKTLTLSWPTDYLGWRLQVQTNSLSTGLEDNWVTIPDSETTTSISITIDPEVGSVFYRMVYP
ncbi:MAG TPA: hypothetical protein VN673_19455, partial [Clostridia bacterium]|nr:hypothetical protein [Clostridia bacterium]